MPTHQLKSCFGDDEDADHELPGAVNRAPVWREGSQIGTGYFLTFTLTARAEC